MSSKIIEVTNLKKNYGNLTAVDNIDFYVDEGSLFAFLGPNGAGKSTTIDMLSTLTTPDSGEILINGKKIGESDKDIRKEIGIVFQDGYLDDLLTVRENLLTRSSFYGLKKKERKAAVDNALSIVSAEEFADRRYGKLSGGQRRKADIARALVNTPKILFLDEPTTGLDPQTRKNVWDAIHMLKEKMGVTVFLTTHYMEEAAQADYITIMVKGEIQAKGTPIELKNVYATDMLKVKPLDKIQFTGTLKKQNMFFLETSEEIILPIKNTIEAVPLIDEYRSYFESFEVLRGSLEDVFINVVDEEDGIE